jgi:hypothetical protein
MNVLRHEMKPDGLLANDTGSIASADEVTIDKFNSSSCNLVARRFFSRCRRRSASINTSCGSLLLALVAQPAKVRPAPIFTLREPLDQFEVNLGAVLLHDHAEALPRPMAQAELFQLLQLA